MSVDVEGVEEEVVVSTQSMLLITLQEGTYLETW